LTFKLRNNVDRIIGETVKDVSEILALLNEKDIKKCLEGTLRFTK